MGANWYDHYAVHKKFRLSLLQNFWNEMGVLGHNCAQAGDNLWIKETNFVMNHDPSFNLLTCRPAHYCTPCETCDFWYWYLHVLTYSYLLLHQYIRTYLFVAKKYDVCARSRWAESINWRNSEWIASTCKDFVLRQ